MPSIAHVHRVARLAGDDASPKGCARLAPQAWPAMSVLGGATPWMRVVDRAVAGAAAEIALQRARQVRPLLLVERGGGHDHAGRAEAALEGLRVEEGLLHRMQLAVRGEPLDGGDLPPRGAKGRHQAGMHRLAVEPHRAGAAIAGVAALLDAEHAALAQEGAQALAGPRLGRERLPFDVKFMAVPAGQFRADLLGEMIGEVAPVGRRCRARRRSSRLPGCCSSIARAQLLRVGMPRSGAARAAASRR